MLGYGRHNEGVPTAAVAIVNVGAGKVVVFVLAAEGGGDWHHQWWCKRRGERVLTCGYVDSRRRRGHSGGGCHCQWKAVDDVVRGC